MLQGVPAEVGGWPRLTSGYQGHLYNPRSQALKHLTFYTWPEDEARSL